MSFSTEKTALLASPAEAVQRSAPREERGSEGAGIRGHGRRGRPLLMPRETVLEKIRQLARREEGIFRVHLTHSGLYARARRMFGSWSSAVEAAGVNYQRTIEHARGRALKARRGRPVRRRALQDT